MYLCGTMCRLEAVGIKPHKETWYKVIGLFLHLVSFENRSVQLGGLKHF